MRCPSDNDRLLIADMPDINSPPVFSTLRRPLSATRRHAVNREVSGLSPLAIGTTLGFIVMVGGPLTGGSFNPARWFGPALANVASGNGFAGSWWLYILGPIVGSLLAAATFKFVLEPGGAAPTEPPERVRAPAPKPATPGSSKPAD